MATYRNYHIKSSKGVFYESSADKIEGFDIETQTLSKETRWHKETKELRGVLSNVFIQAFEDGKRKYVKLVFDEASGAIGSLMIPLFTDRKSIDPWVKAFLPAMYNPMFKPGIELVLALNRKDKQTSKANGKQYLWKNAYFKIAPDTRIDWGFNLKTDVPKPKEVTHPVDGSKSLDWTEVDVFYYQKLMEIIARFKEATEDAPEATRTEEKPYTPPTNPGGAVYTGAENYTPEDEGDYDDLPF